MSVHEPTETRILDLAAQHIRRFGPGRTTVTAIAGDLGMSHANVYRYYPSKAALLEAVTGAWLRPIESALHDIADGPDPADDKLERMLGALARFYRRKLDDDVRIFDLYIRAIEAGHGVARKHRNRVQSEIARVIEDGMGAGAFPTQDQRRAMALVFDLLHRFIHPVCVGLDRDVPRSQIDARFERAVGLTLRALAQGLA
jgi:AcrR family transcriptional regulator